MNKFVSQQERMANISPKLKKQMEELNKEGYHEEEYQYFHEKDGRPLIDWEEYEKTLDKANLTELIIKPNVFKFKDNKLVLKDYPNLKTLYACGLGLQEVELDCSSLENLYLTGNNLKQIDLSKVTSLRNLLVNRNCLKELNVKHLIHLEDLRCNVNDLTDLDVASLTQLKILDSSMNELDEIILGNNPSLWSLDLAENKDKVKIIDALNPSTSESCADFPFLPALEMLSLRLTHLRAMTNGVVLILSSPKLTFLDYHRSNVDEVFFHVNYPLNNPDQLRVFNTESHSKFNVKGNHNPDVATEWEDRVYRMHQQREKEWINGEWGFAFEDNPKKNIYYEKPEDKQKTDDEKEEVPPITDPAQLTSDYQEHPQKNTLTHLTITHLGLTGTMIIDGYPELEDLNIGNNYLSYLVIKNCPKLKTLRYAHNKMRHEAFVENCPQLTTIDKENYNGGMVWDEKGEEQFEKDELKGKDNLNEEWSEKPKPKPQTLTEEQKNLVRISSLVLNAEQALKDNDLKKVAELLEEIKKYANTKFFNDNKFLIESVRKLEQALLEKQNNKQSILNVTNPPNYWPVVIICSIFLLFWICLYWKMKVEDEL